VGKKFTHFTLSNQVSEGGILGLGYFGMWDTNGGQAAVALWEVHRDENDSRPDVSSAEVSHKEFPKGSQNIALNKTFNTYHNPLVAKRGTGHLIYEDTSQT
jgi:hypothetical protein